MGRSAKLLSYLAVLIAHFWAWFYCRVCIVVFLVLLAGCVTQKVARPVTWQQHQPQMLALSQWKVHGRIALKAPGQSFTANLFWLQQGLNYRIDLFGPIGLGAVKFVGSPGQFSLTDSHGKKYQATTPEELMVQQLGWSLPVSELFYWVRGIPAPGSEFSQCLDEQERLAGLKQDGWEVSYQKYQVINGLWFPKKLQLVREGLEMTLILSHVEFIEPLL